MLKIVLLIVESVFHIIFSTCCLYSSHLSFSRWIHQGVWGAGDRSEYGEQTRIQNEDVLIENFEEKKRQSYCLSDGKSAARIKIFQRSATNSLRKFININEVVRLAQDYTTERVEIVSVNASTSIAEQIRFFNEFDLLITPHGSHLANGIFTVRPQNKVSTF